MSDGQLILGMDMDGAPTVMHGAKAQKSLKALWQAAGDSDASDLAQAVNHLCRGYDFVVILDVQAFVSKFRETRAAEPADAPWQEGAAMLSDFAEPDLNALTDPVLTGDALVFFARDDFTGLPYRVETNMEKDKIVDVFYDPVAPSAG